VATWTRRALADEDVRGLGLTPEEGFVLSRLDVPLSSAEVVALTGFAPDQADHILARLMSKGAILAEGALLSEPPLPFVSSMPPDMAGLEDVDGDADLPFADTLSLPPEGAAGSVPPASHSITPSQEPPPEEEPSAESDLEKEEAKLDEGNFRKVYESEFRHKERDERVAAATTATGGRLLALCFDPDPVVIRAILSNGEYTLVHARLAARHHPNPAGLEGIAQRSDVLHDPQVQRALLRNIQLSEPLSRRILMPKRMMDVYKVTIDTDVPERTRHFARGVLRSKFATSQGEERAGLIAATEGRVMPLLTGLSLDGRATQILCARSYNSVLFIQNLARFGACPPLLLAHLLKQPLVRRQQHLKNMLLQHPNMPSDAKRRL
jgi:hypothetical protein